MHRLGLLLLCACAADAGGPEPLIRSAQQWPDREPGCLAWRAEGVADGQPSVLVGRACQRSDGAWEITEGPPEAPTRTQAVYRPPAPAYAGFYDPAFFGPPLGTSLGVRVFLDAAGTLHPDPRPSGDPRTGFRFDQPAEGRLGRGPLPLR